MAFSDDFLYQLRQANPLESVASSYVELKRSGSDLKCCCPFHSEKTPSCYIHPAEQYFHCFGCGVGGDVITFVRLAENLDYVEAVRLLAQRCGMTVPDDNTDRSAARLKTRCLDINRETANFYYKYLFSDGGKPGRAYLSQRGINSETVKKYALGFSPGEWGVLKNHLLSLGFSESELLASGVVTKSSRDGANSNCYDFFRARVMFPIVDLRGNVVAFGGRRIDGVKENKYLNSRENVVYHKGRYIYSLNFAKNSNSKRLILTEGYMDTVSLNQAGFENACAVLGTAMTSEQARLIKPYCDEAVLALDADEAGQTAIARTINILNEVGIRTRVLKIENAKDPDEYIKKFGSEDFRRLVNHSGDAVLFRLERCLAGLDLQTAAGKSEYIKRCVKVLASIDNIIDREIYSSKTASELEISPSVLKEAIETEVRHNKYSAKKKEKKNIASTIVSRDELNPEAMKNLRESKAEEGIIAYLLSRPESASFISGRISSDLFVTGFNKKLFEVLLHNCLDSSEFSLSRLGSELSVEEMGRITGIKVQFSGIPLGEPELDEFIGTLTDYRLLHKGSKPSELTDDELLRLQRVYENIDRQ